MRSPSPPPKEIRDPIHGAIQADSQELTIIDHPAVQRLRGIRQLGFSHLPFPGATHTRYAHSLGAMHLAGQDLDACFRDHPFSSLKKERAYRRGNALEKRRALMADWSAFCLAPSPKSSD